MNRTRAATAGLALPALMALGMSADTSYRFLGEHLGITNRWERGALCGVAEAAILALSLYSWATRARGAAYLAYCIVLVQAVPAFEVSAVAGGIARVALGPVLLAVMLHLLLGLEVRMSGARPDGILRAALREIRERLTAYLGIGRRGADSAAIARSRAADRAVTLADRVAAADPASRRYRRRTATLAEAIDAARHGLDSEAAGAAEAAIVARIVRRKSVADLAAIDARHDWTTALPKRNPGGTQGPAPAEQAEHFAEPLAEHMAEQAEPQSVPAPSVPAEVPVEQSGTPVAGVHAAGGTAGEQPGNSRTGRNGGGAAAERPALAVVRNNGGTRAEHIRALVADGVTDAGTIRNILTASGVPVPSDRYIRRLVSETRNTSGQSTGTNGYM